MSRPSYVACQMDAKQFGRYGGAFLFGLAYLADRAPADPARDPRDTRRRVTRVFEYTPCFLMCRFCAHHFASQMAERPIMPLLGLRQRPRVFLSWMHECWTQIADQTWKTGEASWFELWLQERWEPQLSRPRYWRQRMSKGYVQFWLYDMLVFLSLVVAACPPCSEWSDELRSTLFAWMNDALVCIGILDSTFADLRFCSNDTEFTERWFGWISSVLSVPAAHSIRFLLQRVFRFYPMAATQVPSSSAIVKHNGTTVS